MRAGDMKGTNGSSAAIREFQRIVVALDREGIPESARPWRSRARPIWPEIGIPLHQCRVHLFFKEIGELILGFQ